MPSKWTFTIRPIKELIGAYMYDPTVWFDPMAGMHSLAGCRNDINPESNAQTHLPALEFLTKLSGKWGGCLFDPPYSIHQVKVSYDNYGLSLAENITGGFPKEKDRIADLLVVGGYVISCGWNSVGMGKKRGFLPVEHMLVCHGGNRNDTIVTVEVNAG